MARLLTPDDRREHRVITVELSERDIEELEREILKKYQKRARIPGFRPGKAPEAIVKAHYADAIRADAIEDAANEAFRKELEARKIKYAVNVEFTDFRKKPDGSGYTFTVEFDTIPRFDIPPLNQIKVVKKIKRVTELEVEQTINEQLKRLGEYVPVDREAREGDFIFFDLTIFEVKENGKLKPIKNYENRMLKLDKNEIPEDLFNQFMGKKAGDKVETEQEATDEKGKKLRLRYVYEIKSVREFQIPELDDELAQDLGYESVEDMRQKVREELERRAHEDSESDVETEIALKIHEIAGFDVPQFLVDRNRQFIRERMFGIREGEEGELKELIDRVATDIAIKETVIYNVIEELDPEVTEEEIEKELEEIARSNNLDKELYVQELKKRSKYEEVIEDIKEKIRRRKAWDYLKSGVSMEVVVE